MKPKIVTEQEARENAKPLSHAVLSVAPVKKPQYKKPPDIGLPKWV